ncbi:hypothetical protein ABVT39_014655 [Epinephelus coioides]
MEPANSEPSWAPASPKLRPIRRLLVLKRLSDWSQLGERREKGRGERRPERCLTGNTITAEYKRLNHQN